MTPRRWLAFSNPELAELITKSLGNEQWITHTDELQGLLKFVDDKDFRSRWHQIKQDNKQKLAAKIKVRTLLLTVLSKNRDKVYYLQQSFNHC